MELGRVEMAGKDELNEVSSAILDMDTLLVDSMDLRLEALPDVVDAAVSSGAQSIGAMSSDSPAGERVSQCMDDVHEIENAFDTGAQGMESSGAKETNLDDGEGLMADPGALHEHGIPGTSQEALAQDAHNFAKSKELAENDVALETGRNDEGVMANHSTPNTPNTPQEEFPKDVQGPDAIKDMNVDEDENILDEERGSGDEVLDPKSGAPQGEVPPEDFDAPAEMNDTNVEGPENELEVLGDGEGREKSLDGEKFVAPFPMSRVKRIIKLDKDVRLVTSDAIAVVAQATALFVQNLSSASFTVMLRTKRKTIRGPDVVLAAKSTRQFRECLGNDLATLLEESNGDTAHGEDDPVEKDHGTSDESLRTRSQHQKSAKKHQLAAPPGSRPITNFFKA